MATEILIPTDTGTITYVEFLASRARWQCRYCKRSTLNDHIDIEVRGCLVCGNEHQVCIQCFRDAVGRIVGEFPYYELRIKQCPKEAPLLEPIDSFRTRYRFLSNFAPSRVFYLGLPFDTVEHAYQAAKAVNREDVLRIQAAATPSSAKRMGRTLKAIRPDWDTVKFGIMEEILRLKFDGTTYLTDQLRATNKRPLIEANRWGDRIWGTDMSGVGDNHLGTLLMKVRADLKTSISKK